MWTSQLTCNERKIKRERKNGKMYKYEWKKLNILMKFFCMQNLLIIVICGEIRMEQKTASVRGFLFSFKYSDINGTDKYFNEESLLQMFFKTYIHTIHTHTNHTKTDRQTERVQRRYTQMYTATDSDYKLFHQQRFKQGFFTFA